MEPGAHNSSGNRESSHPGFSPPVPDAGMPSLDTSFSSHPNFSSSDAVFELAADILAGHCEQTPRSEPAGSPTYSPSALQSDLEEFIRGTNQMQSDFGDSAVSALHSMLRLTANDTTPDRVRKLPDVVRSVFERFGDGNRFHRLLPHWEAASVQFTATHCARFVSDSAALAERLPPSQFDAMYRILLAAPNGSPYQANIAVTALAGFVSQSPPRELISTVFHVLHVASQQGWSPSQALKLFLTSPDRSVSRARIIAERLRTSEPVFSDERVPVDLEYEQALSYILAPEHLSLLRENARETGSRLGHLRGALGLLVSTEIKQQVPETAAAQRALQQRIRFYASRGMPAYRAIREFCSEIQLAAKTRLSDEAVETLLYASKSTTRAVINRAKVLLRDVYGADQHPAASDDTAHTERLFSQTTQIFRGVLDSYYGFSALTFAARHFCNEQHSPLGQLGQDLGRSAAYIYASDRLSFPGRGVIIDGMAPKRFLSSQKDKPDPFSEHKQANPWLADAIDSIEQCSFLFLNGAIAILPPLSTEKSGFTIALENGRREPYACVFFNEHFGNTGRHKAFLVPALVLDSKLRRTRIEMDDWDAGVRSAPADVGTADLTALGLIHACKKYGSPVLDLGTPSVYTGGLCNAFPPGSRPYWNWAASRHNAGQELKDLHGHIHKAFAAGQFQGRMTPALEKQFSHFERGHLDVYETAKLYQSILNLFQLAHSFWNKGLTATADSDMPIKPGRPAANSTGTGADAVGEEQDSGRAAAALPDFYRHSFRLLTQAEQIHARLKEAGISDSRQYPRLVAVPTFKYAAPPKPGFSFDTYDLTLSVADHPPVALGSMPSEHRQLYWQKLVLPLYNDNLTDFRFYEKE